jgi:hypothetical protein
MSSSVSLLVDSLYAEAAEAVESCTALPASIPELILIFGDINSNVRFETKPKL